MLQFCEKIFHQPVNYGGNLRKIIFHEDSEFPLKTHCNDYLINAGI